MEQYKDTSVLEKHTVSIISSEYEESLFSEALIPTYTSIFRAEDGGSMFLQSAGTYLQVHMGWQIRKATSINVYLHLLQNCLNFHT
jgi:hypothetical protein